MSKLLKALQNPALIFGFLIIGYSFFSTLRNDNLSKVIRSDGRGYYAYLPALFIYNDGSFAKSAQAEKAHSEHGIDQLYLFKDPKGKIYNKYFPGIAVLQSPFFGLACTTSWISGQPIDGYSSIFQFFYYLGSLFYTFCGLLLFANCLKKLFPEQKILRWLVPLAYFATPLFFYSIFTPSFSHLYSFFLFGAFASLILKLKETFNLHTIFLTGIVLGLIALVRPTNLTIVLMLPFLLGNTNHARSFFRKLFQDKCKALLTGLSGFLLVVFLLFLCWKWQTGSWIVWSYSGEGFNFLHPQLFATLFSFRTGLFLHAPVMFLSLAGLCFLFRENKFQAFCWSIYFMINIWIVASWWCWDYESSFGNRPLTEHFFFLLMPAVFLLKKYGRFSMAAFILLALVGIVRCFESKTGFMLDQRFTKANYMESLKFWKTENNNRWNFTHSCVPFGNKISSETLLDEPGDRHVTPQDEFPVGTEKMLHQPRSNEKFYCVVELEKRIFDPALEGVMLVIDAYNADNSKRYYRTTELFNDRQEGNKDWTSTLRFEAHIHDYLQEYDFVKIYIWNPGKKDFYLRKVKIVLEEYKAEL